MPTSIALNRPSLALLTDLYELTMASGYWKSGLDDAEAVFNLFFRRAPFGGGYAIACGLEYVIDYLATLKFHDDDLEYLATLRGNDAAPLFDAGFLDYLGHLSFQGDVDAVPEGTAVFPHEPLVRVRGPLVAGQLVESALLNMINFQTLIATKAARVCQAAAGDPVLEFGLRRAQGIDGGLSASRAAYIGGCAATSNVLAGKMFGIPVEGTLAHSWVMAFDNEPTAFSAYAEAMPNNCVFLVDTYDTKSGVGHAIDVGRQLRKRGHEMIGVRLDSGDLTSLSIKARRMLDEAGFPEAKIFASSDLDESLIEKMKRQGARIDAWGVGTRLATAYDQPALGGVYKLTAIRRSGQSWEYKLKLSEEELKTSNPGIQQVRRYEKDGRIVRDVIYDERIGPPRDGEVVHSVVSPAQDTAPDESQSKDLLVPVFRAGKLVYDTPSIEELRSRTQDELKRLPPEVRRLADAHQFPVGLEDRYHKLKMTLVAEAHKSVEP